MPICRDDIQVIPEMVQAIRPVARRWCMVVRKQPGPSDGFFKRATAQGFYRLISALGAESVYNHADFRLMSRRAVEALKSFREVNLFLRGNGCRSSGFKSAIVYYTRSERFAGGVQVPAAENARPGARCSHLVFRWRRCDSSRESGSWCSC